MNDIEKTTVELASEYNPNNYQSANWVATFAGFEDIIFKLKSFVLPSVTLGQNDVGSNTGNISIHIPGDHIIQDEFTFDFYIDSDFVNYTKLLHWMKYNSLHDQPVFSDMSIHILSPTGKMQGVEFIFKNAWIMSLSQVLLDVENSDTDVFTNAVFKYEEYDVASNLFN